MKRIKLYIHEPTINKAIGNELNLLLDKNAHLLDAIREVDRIIGDQGSFPVPDYRSLLHMIYNPVRNKFYKQVAITAHKQSGQMLNVRGNPKKVLPQGTTVTVIPAGGCISEWEEAIDYEEFSEAIST